MAHPDSRTTSRFEASGRSGLRPEGRRQTRSTAVSPGGNWSTRRFCSPRFTLARPCRASFLTLPRRTGTRCPHLSMKTLPLHFSCLGLALVTAAPAVTAAATPREISFQKQALTDQYWCDGINAADINRDGKPDVIAGPFWYAGPDFKTPHAFYEPVPQPVEEKPTNSMFSFPYDFNGDGWTDILVLGRVLFHEAFWYENPGKADVAKPDGRWKKHLVSMRVFGESPLFEDVNGDGKPEIVSISGQTANDKIKQWGWYAPDWAEPTKPWKFFPITEKADFNHYYHGEGIGDINGDGRADLVLNEGWWEQPPKQPRPRARYGRNTRSRSVMIGAARRSSSTM